MSEAERYRYVVGLRGVIGNGRQCVDATFGAVVGGKHKVGRIRHRLGVVLLRVLPRRRSLTGRRECRE